MTRNNFVTLGFVHKDNYPDPPFNPSESFPEFSSTMLIEGINPFNSVYSTVRTLLSELKLDTFHFGTHQWNPFCDIIKPGDNVVIKPNLVFDNHYLGSVGTLCTISHASVIRPLIDYILLACREKCKITICDNPLQNANWERLITISGLKELQTYYEKKNIQIELLDLRREISEKRDGVITKRIIANNDPQGYIIVDLGENSDLMPIIQYNKKFRIANYGREDLSIHHNAQKNEYCISRTILAADVFINVPKLKTHRIGGISCALKNIIGINGDKRYLAHHREGGIKKGGDEYPSFRPIVLIKHRIWIFLKNHQSCLQIARFVKRVYLGKKSIEEYSRANPDEIMGGLWYGNDTLWRCILDVNKILFYTDKNGVMQNFPQRKYLCIVDGIISGEGEGPMLGTPKKTGVILAGFNPVAIDKICSDIMGFDYKKIPQINQCFNKLGKWILTNFDPEEITTNIKNLPNFNFKSSAGWKRILNRKDSIIISEDEVKVETNYHQ